jgi:hypothetical protein
LAAWATVLVKSGKNAASKTAFLLVVLLFIDGAPGCFVWAANSGGYSRS